MIVYCSMEECKHWNDGKCACIWPCGHEAIKLEANEYGWWSCTDYAPKDGGADDGE